MRTGRAATTTSGWERLLAAFERRSLRTRWLAYAALPSATFALAFALGVSSPTLAARPATTAEQFMPGSGMSALEIFLHNARLLTFVLGGGILTFSLGGLLLLLVNGANVGSGTAFFASSYGYDAALVGVFPHGSLEIVAYVLAATVACRVSVLAVAWQGGDVQPFDRRTLAELVGTACLAFGLLAVAAIIEAHVSPAVMAALS